MEHLGIFKKHHIDGYNLKFSFQKVVNELRYPYDPLTTPPILHTPKYGAYSKEIVSKTQLTPQELIDSSWVLKREEYYQHFCRACRARVQLSNTWKLQLRDELENQIIDGPLPVNVIKGTLRWMIQRTPCWWVLAMLAVMCILYTLLST